MTDTRQMLEAAARAAGLLNPVGEAYGRLTVLREVERVNPRKRQFLCRCECGKEVSLNLNKLRSGHTRSCGCLHLETLAEGRSKRPVVPRLKHGLNKTPEHRAWVQMKQRCNNPNRKEYEHYGGRGIKVCTKWESDFTAFLADVGPRPGPGYSVDRIDVNGDYEPGNVRWATAEEQNSNTRVARPVTINGKTQTISAWEREMGLPPGMARSREAAGWSIEEAILTPAVPGKKLHKRRAAAAIGSAE